MAKRADLLEITPEEFIALVEIAKAGFPFGPPSVRGVALRAYALLMFSRFGGCLSARQIAEKLNLTSPTVRSWRGAFERTVDRDRLTVLREIQAKERFQAELFDRICEEFERSARRLNYAALAKDLRSDDVDVVRQQLRQIFDREITRRLGNFRNDFINGIPDLGEALRLANEQNDSAEQEDMEAFSAICNEIMMSTEGRLDARAWPSPNTNPRKGGLLIALGQIKPMISDEDTMTVPYAICLPSKGGPITMFTTTNSEAALPRPKHCGKRRRPRLASQWSSVSLVEFVEELRLVHGLGDEVLAISFPYEAFFSKTVAKSQTPERPDGWQGPLMRLDQMEERLRRLFPSRQSRSKNSEPGTHSIWCREKLGREISEKFPCAQACASAKSIAMIERFPAMKQAYHFRRFEKKIREITEKKDTLLIRDPASPDIEILDQMCRLVNFAAGVEGHSTWFFQRWGQPSTLSKFLSYMYNLELARLEVKTKYALKTELQKYAPDPTPPNPGLLPDTRTQLNRIIEMLPQLNKSGRKRVLDEVMRTLKKLTDNPPSCFVLRLTDKDKSEDVELRERYKRQMKKVMRHVSSWNKTISKEQKAAMGPFRRSFLSENFTYVAEAVFHSKFRNVVFKDKNEAWQAVADWSATMEKVFNSERFLDHFCDG